MAVEKTVSCGFVSSASCAGKVSSKVLSTSCVEVFVSHSRVRPVLALLFVGVMDFPSPISTSRARRLRNSSTKRSLFKRMCFLEAEAKSLDTDCNGLLLKQMQELTMLLQATISHLSLLWNPFYNASCAGLPGSPLISHGEVNTQCQSWMTPPGCTDASMYPYVESPSGDAFNTVAAEDVCESSSEIPAAADVDFACVVPFGDETSSRKGCDEEDQATAALQEAEAHRRKEKALHEKLQGNEAFKIGDYRRAISIYDNALISLMKDAEPKLRAAIHANVTQCFLKLDRFEAAEAEASEALGFEPENSKVLFRRGQARIKLGDTVGAARDFCHASKLEPDNKEIAAKFNEALCACEEQAAEARQVQVVEKQVKPEQPVEVPQVQVVEEQAKPAKKVIHFGKWEKRGEKFVQLGKTRVEEYHGVYHGNSSG